MFRKIDRLYVSYVRERGRAFPLLPDKEELNKRRVLAEELFGG